MNEYINTLKDILAGIELKYLFPCIQDIVSSEIKAKHLSSGQKKFTRQDITQYLAAWFKFIGISQDECKDWMIEYSVQVLSGISASSHSKIRHSTKSNLKYIYKSDVSFDCGCENNVVSAVCSQDCHVYQKMSDKYEERKKKLASQSYEPEPMKDIVYPEIISAKEKYREQFEKAMETAHSLIEKGLKKKDIAILLNKKEFKTRTGKNWTYSILMHELKKYNGKSEES